MHFLRLLRVLAISVAVSVSAYGLAAQFVNALLLRSLWTALLGSRGVDSSHERIGWGFMFLVTSHLTVVLPALVIAFLTLKSTFDQPYALLGKQGRTAVTTTVTNLYPLKGGATELEPELKSGRWLVLEYSIANSNHILTARKSPEIAQSLEGECQVAIRPTLGFEDMKTWLPGSVEYFPSGIPLWVLLEDGKLIAWSGTLTDFGAIQKFVRMKGAD